MTPTSMHTTPSSLPLAPAAAAVLPAGRPRWLSPLTLSLALAAVTLVVAHGVGSEQARMIVTEMLIRVTVVVGMYVFIGNSGIVSFGHTGFMCIGAFAAAWATIDPTAKEIMLPGLPRWLQAGQHGFLAATAAAAALAAGVALLLGATISHLAGITASIATFAFLAIVNSVYGNWDSVTGGTGSLINIPTVVGPWTAWLFACGSIAAAHVFQESRWGLMLRAAREDEVAASSCAVPTRRVRLIAFVLSGALVGMGGALYAQFLGVLSVDAFYLGLSFLTLTMLVIGGIGSLSGAVLGVVAVTALVELLRAGETGLVIGSLHLALPAGSQEIGLGIFLVLVLVLRPAGLTDGREWPQARP